MKKILALFLAVLTLGLCAAGCKKTEDDLLTAKYNYDLSEYIKLAEYKNLPAVGYHIEVTDEAIEQQILDEQARTGEIEDLEDYMKSDEYIEQVAKDKLGMVNDGEIIFKQTD